MISHQSGGSMDDPDLLRRLARAEIELRATQDVLRGYRRSHMWDG